MGHTLVTRFDAEGIQIIHNILKPFSPNKIPFGRNCDRVLANAALDYHMTMFHWGKAMDSFYLDRLEHFHPLPCRLLVTGIDMLHADEGSFLLYFSVAPGEGFHEMMAALETQLNSRFSGFPHITIAVSKDWTETEALLSHILKYTTFPFHLNVEGLDLYHIWKPTHKVRSLLPQSD